MQNLSLISQIRRKWSCHWGQLQNSQICSDNLILYCKVNQARNSQSNFGWWKYWYNYCWTGSCVSEILEGGKIVTTLASLEILKW
jgi:hypothetical protein